MLQMADLNSHKSDGDGWELVPTVPEASKVPEALKEVSKASEILIEINTPVNTGVKTNPVNVSSIAPVVHDIESKSVVKPALPIKIETLTVKPLGEDSKLVNVLSPVVKPDASTVAQTTNIASNSVIKTPSTHIQDVKSVLLTPVLPPVLPPGLHPPGLPLTTLHPPDSTQLLLAFQSQQILELQKECKALRAEISNGKYVQSYLTDEMHRINQRHEAFVRLTDVNFAKIVSILNTPKKITTTVTCRDQYGRQMLLLPQPEPCLKRRCSYIENENDY